MILIGLGSNLGGVEFGSPRRVLEAALAEMPNRGIIVRELSCFYESEPVPKSDQPWFVNAVAAVETELSPAELLRCLHDIEADLGRKRRIRWEARIIDLDIIAYGEQILPSKALWSQKAKDITPDEIIIPHPRLHERLFVLKPLMDICPDWIHPVSGKTVAALMTHVEKGQQQTLQRMP